MLARTYSRKGSKRSSRPATTQNSLAPSFERSPSPSPPRYRKRQKIHVEVVPLTPSPARDSAESSSNDRRTRRVLAEKDVDGSKRQTHRTFTSLSRGPTDAPGTSTPRTPSPHRAIDKPSPLKRSTTLALDREGSASPVKDFSELFTFSGLSQSKRSGQSPKHTGVARRMHPLRRTQTDSSVPSPAGPSSSLHVTDSPQKLSVTRTESIIDLTRSASSSTASHPPTPHKSRSHPSALSMGMGMDDSSSPAIRPPAAGPSNVRTYAGNSRSFLVALPAQSHAGRDLPGGDDLLGASQQTELEEEDFDTRESYTTLRLRYGVDNSEDDPIPPLATADPASTTNSPSGEGKRKGKGRHSAPEPPAERLPEGMMNDLKSISELRSKGEARRFLDEVGYLFEGLDPEGAIGVRRGSAMEIVQKLCEGEFARRAQAADFLGRAWEMLCAAGAGKVGPKGDKVLNTILAFFAALVAKDVTDLADLASSSSSPRVQSHSTSELETRPKNDLVTVLYGMLAELSYENDPLWLVSAGLNDSELKRAGVGKGDKVVLTALWKMVRKKSGLFAEGVVISNRLLISYALSSLPRAFSSDSANLPILLKFLTTELSPLLSRLTAYTSGLPLFQPLSPSTYKESPSLPLIDCCLRLLDGVLLGRWERVDDDEGDADEDGGKVGEKGKKMARAEEMARGDGLGESLVRLCVATEVAAKEARNGSKEQREVAEKCMESALRVLINLTHDSLPWCEAILREPMALPLVVRLIVFAQRQRQQSSLSNDASNKTAQRLSDAAVKNESSEADGDFEMRETLDEDDRGAGLLDRLCLALGLLTNLVQGAPEAKDLLRDALLDPRCPGKRGCTRFCTCPSRTNALSCLAQVYSQLCQSQNDVDSVVRGHVAVLFGLLMQRDTENQEILLDSLPGTTKRRKLTSLLENAREFTAFYVRFSKKAAEVMGREDQEDSQDEDAGEEGDHERQDSGVRRVMQDAKGEDVARSVIQFLETLRRRASGTD